MVGRGVVNTGLEWPMGLVRLCLVRHGVARHSQERFGMANGHVKAGRVGVTLGTAMFGAGRLASVRFGFVCCGLAKGLGEGRCGTVCLGYEWCGQWVWNALQWRGFVGLCMERLMGEGRAGIGNVR